MTTSPPKNVADKIWGDNRSPSSFDSNEKAINSTTYSKQPQVLQGRCSVWSYNSETKISKCKSLGWKGWREARLKISKMVFPLFKSPFQVDSVHSIMIHHCGLSDI